MESGAKGCEVVVSGKLRAARAKSMKFTDGFMIHSGQPARDFVDHAVRHVMLKQGVLGIKVKMSVDCFLRTSAIMIVTSIISMKGHDPEGHTGPRKPLPDSVTIMEPPADKIITEPTSESRGVPDAQPIIPAVPLEEAYQPDAQLDAYQQDQQPTF